MAIRVTALRPEDESAYERMLLGNPSSLFYSSLRYRDFLRQVVPWGKDRYLAAFDDQGMAGVLPCFVHRGGALGTVVNSLPFWGSNGGLVFASRISERGPVALALIDAYVALAEEVDAVSATLISNPLTPMRDLYQKHLPHDFTDYRLGQLTRLPVVADSADPGPALMDMFHQKTRNMVRKAQKNGLRACHDSSLDAMRKLYDLHCNRLHALGGMAKPWNVFQAIREVFSYDRDYRVYLAEKQGRIVAALLVFHFNKSVEYYIPASEPEFRTLQPMSLLIFESMKDAVRRGASTWNWGGTWESQKGVYRFKSRWGATDRRYHYYTWLRDRAILDQDQEAILSAFPFFYVCPFSELRSQAGAGTTGT